MVLIVCPCTNGMSDLLQRLKRYSRVGVLHDKGKLTDSRSRSSLSMYLYCIKSWSFFKLAFVHKRRQAGRFQPVPACNTHALVIGRAKGADRSQSKQTVQGKST